MTTKKTTSKGKNGKPLQEWDSKAIATWANRAKPTSRLAMWLLAQGLEMSTRELNGVAMSIGLDSSVGAIGAIVGGIKAYATNNDLPSPLEDGYNKEDEKRRIYWMRKKLCKQFFNLLKDSEEAKLVQDLPYLK